MAINKASEKFDYSKRPVKVYIAKGVYKPTIHPNGGTGERYKHF